MLACAGAIPRCSSPTLPTIIHVLLMRARQQVGRIAARPNIATMPDNQTLWDLTFGKFISDPVGVMMFTPFGELTITALTEWQEPQPTPFLCWGLIDPIPKTFCVYAHEGSGTVRVKPRV